MADDRFKHVVVLMMENRSFDQMLGALKSVYPKLEGVDPQTPGTNTYQGKRYGKSPKPRPRLPVQRCRVGRSGADRGDAR
jgi:phospholipase C